MTRSPHGWRLGLLAIASMLMLMVAPVLGVSAQADPATEFSTVVGQLSTMTPIAGPTSGSLDAANADSAPAGVSIVNGVAHVEFTVPTVSAGTLWAMAVLFRVSTAGQNFLLVFPDGTWQLENGQQGGAVNGTGATFDNTPGASAAIDVVFNGAQGSFGVNGAFVSALDLTAIQSAGDVELSGYLGLGAGATTLDYTNFSVYDLPGAPPTPTTASGLSTETATVAASPTTASGLPTETATVAAPPTQAVPATEAVPPTAVTGDPAAIFNQYLAAEATAPIVYGPQSGTMLHDPEKLTFVDTGVTVTDFGAHIECTAPRSAVELWDCGLAFRDTNSPNHYRLGIVSDGHWFLSVGNQDSLQSGSGVPIAPNAGDKVALDLVVVGDKGYFGVDGNFVSELDLSAIPGPGSVSAVIGFFNETFIQGGQTAYEDFVIWDLSAGGVTPAETATTAAGVPTVAPPPVETATTVALPVETPTTIAPPVETATTAALPTETPAAVATATASAVPALAGVTGNSYLSPTFGYTLAWDDTWTAVQASSQNQVDVLRLSNGVITTDVYSGVSAMTTEECLTSLATFYQQDPSYTNVVIQPFADGQTVITEGSVSIATLTFDLSDGTTATPMTDSAICISMPAQGALVSMESYGPTDQFASQQSAISALQAQLMVDGAPVVLPAVPVGGAPTEMATVTGPTVAAPTATVATAPSVTASGTGSFNLIAVDGSGVSGIGTIGEQARSITLSAILLGSQPGSTVGIAHGTCAELATVLEPDYYVGETTETGIIQETVPVSLSVLLTRGPYAVVVYGPGDGAPMVACGEITGA